MATTRSSETLNFDAFLTKIARKRDCWLKKHICLVKHMFFWRSRFFKGGAGGRRPPQLGAGRPAYIYIYIHTYGIGLFIKGPDQLVICNHEGSVSAIVILAATYQSHSLTLKTESAHLSPIAMTMFVVVAT